MAILLTNGTYIHPETLEFSSKHILVHEGLEGKIELLNQLPDDVSNLNIIDCKGKYVTQSFVCGHHHVYSALARGMGAPKVIPKNFNEILQYVWWTLDTCLDVEMIEASALTTAMACIKNGVTFVIDHHASPNYIKGSLDIIARAFEQVGASHLLCYEITDRGGLEKAQQGLDETAQYLSSRQGLVGLHASFTVSYDTLQKAVSLAKEYKSGIHIHVAEAESDQEHCVEHYHKRIVERLQQHGMLDFEKTILGHCLHLNDAEKELIRNSPCWVVQNTESNLNNNVGYFNGAGLGSNIMVGTDGMHSDMLRSAKAAFFVGQRFDNINYESVYQRFRNADRYLKTNGFNGHSANNLVVLDYDTPTAFGQDNFLGHFVFGLNAAHVRHVVSKGEMVLKDKVLTRIDEGAVLEQSRMLSKRLWKKMQVGY